MTEQQEDDFEPGPRDIVLHCFDPLRREVIAIYERRRHISTRHPEVDRHFAAVRLTVHDPHRIVLDKTYRTRRNYYRHGALPPPYDRLFLKVCVEFSPNGLTGIIGNIITAYPTTRIDPKEAQEWP